MEATCCSARSWFLWRRHVPFIAMRRGCTGTIDVLPASRFPMSPLCFTLRHNALTFDWELVEDTGARAVVHYLTRNAACADVAIDAQVLRRGATVRIHGADGGYEAERTFAA